MYPRPLGQPGLHTVEQEKQRGETETQERLQLQPLCANEVSQDRTGQPEGPISIMEQTNSLTSALSFHI